MASPRSRQAPHPLDHQPAFRALVAAAPPVAELALQIAARELISAVAIACSDLADGFAAPPASPRRVQAHRRALHRVRALDRAVAEAIRRGRVPAGIAQRARRALDRADVWVGALLPE